MAARTCCGSGVPVRGAVRLGGGADAAAVEDRVGTRGRADEDDNEGEDDGVRTGLGGSVDSGDRALAVDGCGREAAAGDPDETEVHAVDAHTTALSATNRRSITGFSSGHVQPSPSGASS
jgi:hypothetical protein